jgi:hypothetical protein
MTRIRAQAGSGDSGPWCDAMKSFLASHAKLVNTAIAAYTGEAVDTLAFAADADSARAELNALKAATPAEISADMTVVSDYFVGMVDTVQRVIGGDRAKFKSLTSIPAAARESLGRVSDYVKENSDNFVNPLFEERAIDSRVGQTTTVMIEPTHRGWGGRYALKDGEAVVATARTYVGRRGFEFVIAGRRLTVVAKRRSGGFEAIDEATGQKMLDLIFTTLQVREEAAYVTLSTGVRLYWTLKMREGDRMTGFYDEAGNEIVTVGHHVPWQPSARHGVWGNLWRFWFAFAKAGQYFSADIADAVAARLLRRDETLTLVMLGAWLDMSQDMRMAARGSLSS